VNPGLGIHKHASLVKVGPQIYEKMGKGRVEKCVDFRAIHHIITYNTLLQYYHLTHKSIALCPLAKADKGQMNEGYTNAVLNRSGG
jgi:hypothetical protein